MERTPEEIRTALYAYADRSEAISERFSGMTYIEGIKEALEWALGDCTNEDFLGEVEDLPLNQ